MIQIQQRLYSMSSCI